MSERLDQMLSEHFEGTPNGELMRRMQRAPDFGYDDESYELTRRLGAVGLRWQWAGPLGSEYVEIVGAEDGGGL